MIDDFCMLYVVWCLVGGVWCILDDGWRMMDDVWCLTYGGWCTMSEQGWFMVHGSSCLMDAMMHDGVWPTRENVWWFIMVVVRWVMVRERMALGGVLWVLYDGGLCRADDGSRLMYEVWCNLMDEGLFRNVGESCILSFSMCWCCFFMLVEWWLMLVEGIMYDGWWVMYVGWWLVGDGRRTMYDVWWMAMYSVRGIMMYDWLWMMMGDGL